MTCLSMFFAAQGAGYGRPYALDHRGAQRPR
jgi:hypothetical protein